MKKVAILDGKIIHVYRDDEEMSLITIQDAIIEERDMNYSLEDGWFEVKKEKELSDKERIEQLELANEGLATTLDFLLVELIPSIIEE